MEPLEMNMFLLLEKHLKKELIDYAVNEGKRSGAYSSGSYVILIHILIISWTNSVDNLFTLVYELGHIHSYYTRNNQPYVYGNYTIFDEIASITNKLLNEYLLENIKMMRI